MSHWKRTGFAVVIQFEQGRSGGVWLVFNFQPEDADGARSAVGMSGRSDGLGGELPGLTSRVTMAKLANGIAELGHSADVRVTKTSTSLRVAKLQEIFRLKADSSLICRIGPQK